VNYYAFHIGDFRSGTANMGRLQRAIYRELIDICYDTEKPLPLDMEELYDAIGAESDEEQKIVDRLLRFKFVKRDDGYYHEVCERVIADYHAKAAIAKENGKLGGRPVGSKNNPKKPSGLSVGTGSVPDRNRMETGSKPNQEPKTNNQEPKEKVNTTVERRRPTGEATAINEVFAYWQLRMGHEASKLDAKRVRAIKARLADGYTVGQLCQAVDGCKNSPYHQGQNDTRTLYDDIELICRDATKVDGFIKRFSQGPPNGRTANAQQTIDNLQAYLAEHEN